MESKQELAKRLFHETALFCELLTAMIKSHNSLTEIIDKFYGLDPNFLTELARAKPFGLEVSPLMKYFIDKYD